MYIYQSKDDQGGNICLLTPPKAPMNDGGGPCSPGGSQPLHAPGKKKRERERRTGGKQTESSERDLQANKYTLSPFNPQPEVRHIHRKRIVHADLKCKARSIFSKANACGRPGGFRDPPTAVCSCRREFLLRPDNIFCVAERAKAGVFRGPSVFGLKVLLGSGLKKRF